MTDQVQRFIFGLLAVAGFLSLLGWLGYLLKTEGVTVENGPLLTLLTERSREFTISCSAVRPDRKRKLP